MRNKHIDDTFKIYRRVFHSPRAERFVIPLPEFLWKLLFSLVGALIPISLAVLPMPAGLIAASLIIVFEVLICRYIRLSLLEWAVIVVIGFLLFAISLPAVSTDHSWRNERERRSQAKPVENPSIAVPLPINKRP